MSNLLDLLPIKISNQSDPIPTVHVCLFGYITLSTYLKRAMYSISPVIYYPSVLPPKTGHEELLEIKGVSMTDPQ